MKLRKKDYKKLKKEFAKFPFVKFVAFFALIVAGFWMGVNKDNLNLGNLNLRPAKLSKAEIVTAKELKKLLTDKPTFAEASAGKDFTFINVHTPYEGEIEKTDSFIEFDSIKANEAQLPKDKNTSIILYCKSGRMSAEALQVLKGMGYTNVKHLKGGMDAWKKEGFDLMDLSNLPGEVLPETGFELPVAWGNVGPTLVDLGVIDLDKFTKTVNPSEEQTKILTQETQAPIRIDAKNGQYVVDILWALGLAQRSKVYEEGPMGKEYKDRVGNFASTGGWTLAKGEAVNYLNKFEIIPLSSDHQDKVSEIAKGVFRPCCGNPTWFPDCNHGMAALAAIELMVYQGLSDEEIYKNVLKLNSFWFPQNYLTLATYFARQGISWDKVDAKLALSEEYSSGQGAQKLYQKVGPLPYGGGVGGSCGA